MLHANIDPPEDVNRGLAALGGDIALFLSPEGIGGCSTFCFSCELLEYVWMCSNVMYEPIWCWDLRPMIFYHVDPCRCTKSYIQKLGLVVSPMIHLGIGSHPWITIHFLALRKLSWWFRASLWFQTVRGNTRAPRDVFFPGCNGHHHYVNQPRSDDWFL